MGKVFGKDLTAVLVIVAVDAEVLPVASILGVVVMVAVLVMHREEPQFFPRELPAAFGADVPVYFRPVDQKWRLGDLQGDYGD